MLAASLRTILASSILFAAAWEVSACSCIIYSLSKRFNDANAVFVGKHVFAPADTEKVQNYSEEFAVFEVLQSWKGVHNDFVAVRIDFPDRAGTCSIFTPQENVQYLVFAYGIDLRVQTVCSDTLPLTDSNGTKQEISQLNSFWFRFWARFRFWR